jgi:hypothetical protein
MSAFNDISDTKRSVLISNLLGLKSLHMSNGNGDKDTQKCNIKNNIQLSNINVK